MGLKNYNYQNLRERYPHTANKYGGDNAGRPIENTENIRSSLKDVQGLPTGERRTMSLSISAIRSDNPDYNDYCIPQARNKNSVTGEFEDGFNTTNHLNYIGDRLKHNDNLGALEGLSAVERFTSDHLKKHAIASNHSLVEGYQAIVNDKIKELAVIINSFDPKKDKVYEIERDVIIVKDGSSYISLTEFGEVIAALVYQETFSNMGVDATMFDLSPVKSFIESQGNPAEVLPNIDSIQWARERIVPLMEQQIKGSQSDLVYGPGYMPTILETGYTENHMAWAAVAAQDVERKVAAVVEKAFCIHSADPRIVPNTRSISRMDPTFATLFNKKLEADGGVIEPGALDILIDYDIPTFVLNPQKTEETTLIQGGHSAQPGGVELVTANKAKLLRVYGKMKAMDKPGIQQTVTEFLAKKGHSIGPNVGRDNSLGFTFPVKADGGINRKQANQLEEELRRKYGLDSGMNTVLEDISLIHCLGNNIRASAKGRVMIVLDDEVGVVNEPMNMADGRHSFVVAVPSELATNAQRAIHEQCVLSGAKV